MPLFLPTYFASLVVARGLNHTIFSVSCRVPIAKTLSKFNR